MVSTISVSKFILSPLSFRKITVLGLVSLHSTCSVWGESDDIQKGRKLTHRRFERITRVSKYQLSSPPVLFCKLGFKYINGRAPHRLPAQDGSMNLAATA